MDLPPVLMDLLNHLLKTHGTVMSWNIYQRDDGIVNVNIRFPNLSDFTTESHVEPVSYRRVSGKQLARNKVRAETHRANQNKNNATVHTQTEHNSTKDTKKRKMDISSPEIHRSVQVVACTNETHCIDTPIKVQDLSVEHPGHNTSFTSSSTSEVNNAQDFECARPQGPNIITKHGQESDCTGHGANEQEVVLSAELHTSIDDRNKTQAKLGVCPVSPTDPDQIVCPCCENIMTPSHICEIDPPSDSTTVDSPPTPPPLENCPQTPKKYNEAHLKEMCSILTGAADEACKTQ